MRILRYLWASPNTLIGLIAALLSRLTGGSWAIHTGVIEAHGGLTSTLLLSWSPLNGGIAAITFGHVVLGVNEATLDVTRDHERVHVRQYERWGPLFIPAYLLASFWQWWQGNAPYRDNPFEVEARAKAG